MSFATGRRRGYRRRSTARRYAEYALTLAIFLVLAVGVARFDRVSTRTQSGNAVVNDGDTITVAGERVRLQGIDAPEFDQTCTRAGQGYSCGREARQALQGLIGGRQVRCTGWQRDKYDRLLGVCEAGGVDLNRRLVELGWAVAYGGYGDAEVTARQGKKGLWAGEFDRPRIWRDRAGLAFEAEHDIAAAIWNWLRQLYADGFKGGPAG